MWRWKNGGRYPAMIRSVVVRESSLPNFAKFVGSCLCSALFRHPLFPVTRMAPHISHAMFFVLKPELSSIERMADLSFCKRHDVHVTRRADHSDILAANISWTREERMGHIFFPSLPLPDRLPSSPNGEKSDHVDCPVSVQSFNNARASVARNPGRRRSGGCRISVVSDAACRSFRGTIPRREPIP